MQKWKSRTARRGTSSLAASVPTAMVLLGTTACTGEMGDAGAVRGTVPFDRVFVLADRMMLATSPDDPVGRVSDIALWGERVVVVDDRSANVKVFDRGGGLLLTLGRAGRGPGEFILPYRAAVVDDLLAVLDRRETQVSFFERDGTYRGRWRIPSVAPGGLDWMPERGRFLFAGKLLAHRREGYLAVPLALHELDVDGTVLESFHPFPEETHRYEGSFNTILSTAVGVTAICGTRSSNEVFHYDRETGQSRVARVGATIYRPVQWLERRADWETIDKWAARQMWLDRFVPLDTDHYAVRFVAYQQDLDPTYRYAVALLDGTTVLATEPTDVALQVVAGDSAYGTRATETGDVELLVHVVRRPLRN